jgi:tetratricopeptide (TPR) repeat protein
MNAESEWESDIADAVFKNLLRLSMNAPRAIPPPAPDEDYFSPERLRHWADRTRLTPEELATPPEELADRLRRRLSRLSAADSPDVEARLTALRDDARRLGLEAIHRDIHLALGRFYARTGRLSDAVTAVVSALARPAGRERERWTEATLLLAWLYREAGLNTVAAAVYAAVTEMTVPGSDAHLKALLNGASALGQEGRYDDARERYEACLATSLSVGKPRWAAWARVGLAAVLARDGQTVAAADAARQALTVADANGWDDVARQARTTLSWLDALPPDPAAEGGEASHYDANHLETLALKAYRRGDYPAVRLHAAAGLTRMAEEPGPLFLKARLLWWRALAAHRLGEPEAPLYRDWARDLFSAMLSDPVRQDLPPWPEN